MKASANTSLKKQFPIHKPKALLMMIFQLNPRSLRTAIFFPLIAVFAAVQLASGEDRSTYTTVNNAGETPATWHKRWMSALPDSMLISELSIPGTHDAGCIAQYGDVLSLLADCQDAKIIDQLNAGVRFLDLRVEDTNDKWEIYHGDFQYQPLWNVLIEIGTFLNDNPGETVLVRITVADSDVEAFFPQWPWEFAEPFKDFIWQRKDKFRADGVTPTTYAHEATGDGQDLLFGRQSYAWPTLGEVRGKMVMFFGRNDPLLNEGKGHASGLGYVNHFPPDAEVTVKTFSGIVVGVTRDKFGDRAFNDKWIRDEQVIDLASADSTRETLYTTGINIGATTDGIAPLGFALNMNRKVLDKLNSDANYLRKTGLVLMDYPGPGLLDSIIALNFRHATSSAAVYDDFVQYALNLPFEDKIVSDSVASGVPIPTIWRRLVKERLPSTEFNTYIVTVPAAGSLNVSSSISPTDNSPINRNFLATEFKQGDSFQAIFESNRLPPKVTKNQVKQKLETLYAAGDLNQKTSPIYFKTGFDSDPVFRNHNWVVFRIQTANAVPSSQRDFDENVVWESKFGASGIFTETLIVAGSAKPEPAVESGVSHPTVVGQWDFNQGDLTATVGQDLVNVGGQEVFTPIPNVYAPAFPDGNGAGLAIFNSANGLEMTPGAAPNGGSSAARLNQWTLIMDLLLMEPPRKRSLIQIDTLDNTTDGDLFVSPEGGIGVDGIYHGQMENYKWYRVAIAVDTTREQIMSKYIDGGLVGEQPIRTFNASAAGLSYSYSSDRWSLMDTALLFGDDTGEAGALQVSSIQLRNYKMSAAEVAALDGPSAAGIPDDAMTFSVEGRGLVLEEKENGFERLEDDTFLKDHVKVSWNLRHQLQQSNHPGGPWSDVPDEQTMETPKYFKTEGLDRQFFRLRSR